MSTVRPHEVYNLGAMSHVAVSFPCYLTAVDMHNLLFPTLLSGYLRARSHLKCPNTLPRLMESELYVF